jgi:hypothetical protein
MKKLTLIFLIVFMLALTLAPSVGAQGSGCLTLSADDCAVLQTAAANMASITALNLNVNASLSTGGLAGMASLSPGMSDISMSASASGALTITGSGLFPINADMKGEYSLSGMNFDQSASFDFLAADDFIYFPYQGETLGFEITQDIVSEMDLSALSGGAVPLNLGDMGLQLDTLLGTAITSGLDGVGLDAYITFERQGDTDMMGQTVSPYVFSFDIGSYLASPEFNQMVTQFGPLLGEEFSSVAPMLPMILGGSEGALTITQMVGDDNYIHGFTFAFDFSINLGMLLGDASMDPIAFNVLLDLGMSDLNNVDLATAPSGARIISQEEAQGILQGLSAGF